MNFINIEPSLYQSFFKIFDLPDENGDVYFHVEQDNKEEPITLKEVCDTYEISRWGLFSFAHANIKLQEKIKFEVIEEDGKKFTVMRLAPFLGLPGNKDFKSELNDLKDLLAWFKEKALETPSNNLKIILDAFGETAKLSLYGRNKELTAQLEKEMFEKIEKSPNLTQWVENQKEGILSAKGRLHDLTARFTADELMNLEEKMEYSKLQGPTPKTDYRDNHQSNLRKNKLPKTSKKKHSFW
jgi:hypothetical protein